MQFAQGKEETYRVWYNKNLDPHGHAIYVFAEAWALLMENKISDGKKLTDIAKECAHEAGKKGITRFMYGCAVSILAFCWIYGEELRCWHNLDVQVQHEGEKANENGNVLNPAPLDIW